MYNRALAAANAHIRKKSDKKNGSFPFSIPIKKKRNTWRNARKPGLECS
jgi:hypothetical protein